MDATSLSLWQNIGIFVGAGLLILLVGTWLAGLADRFADRTGIGEAMTGTVFLGLVTSLPGLTTSITAAIDGRPSLTISNALGGNSDATRPEDVLRDSLLDAIGLGGNDAQQQGGEAMNRNFP